MIEKEIRALLPAWTACAIAIVASRYQLPALAYLGFPVYLVGTCGLGAWSLGHEYACGTLPVMLALPVPRWRWWTAKMVVLAPMLAALAGLAAAFVTLDRGDRTFGAALFWLPATTALCVAPWATLLTRSPLAGGVFTLGFLGAAITLGDWIGVYRFGFTSEVDDFRRMFAWWAIGGMSIVGALAGWFTFARLQVTGDHARDWQLLAWPAVVSPSRARPRSRLVALVLKELRLQQLAFVIAGIFALGTVVIVLLERAVPDIDNVFEIVLALYLMTLPALVGSLACAEERQLGTLDGQLLLPLRVSYQWFVKSATALALALTLGLALPAVLVRLLPHDVFRSGAAQHLVSPQMVTLVLVCLAVSLYLSTLASSGMAALLASIAVIPLLAYFDVQVGSRIGHHVFEVIHRARPAHVHRSIYTAGSLNVFAVVALLAALVVVASAHYRRVDRRPGLVALHVGLALVALTACDVAASAIMALRY